MDMFSSTFIVLVWKLDASSERLRLVSSFYTQFFLQLFATLCSLESHYKLYILYQLINVFAHNSLLFCFLVVCFYFIFGDGKKTMKIDPMKYSSRAFCGVLQSKNAPWTGEKGWRNKKNDRIKGQCTRWRWLDLFGRKYSCTCKFFKISNIIIERKKIKTLFLMEINENLHWVRNRPN